MHRETSSWGVCSVTSPAHLLDQLMNVCQPLDPPYRLRRRTCLVRKASVIAESCAHTEARPWPPDAESPCDCIGPRPGRERAFNSDQSFAREAGNGTGSDADFASVSGTLDWWTIWQRAVSVHTEWCPVIAEWGHIGR